MALLITALPWRSAPSASPASAHTSQSPPLPADVRQRRLGLDSLVRCSACHVPADAARDGQLALASTHQHNTWHDDPTLQPDVERVRAGGAVFTRACAGCHGEHREGPWRAGAQRPGVRIATGEPMTPLTDQQIAALAAFLRCHVTAMPLPPQRQRTTL